MTQAEVLRYIRMIVLPTKRLLLALFNAGVLAMICIAQHGFAETPMKTDQRSSGTSVSPVKQGREGADESIRPFHINVPDEQLVDLRRRIAATRWPERETVSDASQGVQLATMCHITQIGKVQP